LESQATTFFKVYLVFKVIYLHFNFVGLTLTV